MIYSMYMCAVVVNFKHVLCWFRLHQLVNLSKVELFFQWHFAY